MPTGGAPWVWFGWWVPIVAWWFPYQVVRDVWRASTPAHQRLPVGWWWFSWLVLTFTNPISTFMLLSEEPLTGSAVDALVFWEVVLGVSGAVAGGLWVLIIIRISAAQRARAREAGINLP